MNSCKASCVRPPWGRKLPDIRLSASSLRSQAVMNVRPLRGRIADGTLSEGYHNTGCASAIESKPSLRSACTIFRPLRGSAEPRKNALRTRVSHAEALPPACHNTGCASAIESKPSLRSACTIFRPLRGSAEPRKNALRTRVSHAEALPPVCHNTGCASAIESKLSLRSACTIFRPPWSNELFFDHSFAQ